MEKKDLKNLKTDDIQRATQEARKKSMKLLEEQGITTLALVVSEFLMKFAEQPNEALYPMIHISKK